MDDQWTRLFYLKISKLNKDQDLSIYTELDEMNYVLVGFDISHFH